MAIVHGGGWEDDVQLLAEFKRQQLQSVPLESVTDTVLMSISTWWVWLSSQK